LNVPDTSKSSYDKNNLVEKKGGDSLKFFQMFWNQKDKQGELGWLK